MKHLNDINDICKNIDLENLGKKYKLLIAFDYLVAYLINNKSFYTWS